MSASEWVSDYVGRPYEDGVAECWHLAAAVWRERFGFEAPVVATLGSTRMGRAMAQAEMADPAWRQVAAPEEGDAVVMARGAVPCHVGVWVAPGHVLHCIRGAGTILTEAERIGTLGYRIVGWWRRA